MQRLKLDGAIVKDVSRSFYLTLRLLPTEMREVISLGYLLARASDTIADTASVTSKVRLTTLSHYERDVKEGQVSKELESLIRDHFWAQKNDGERVLMHSLSTVVSALSSCDNKEQRLLQRVTEVITEGQLWDLTFFQEGELTMVDTPETLERYTYQVAGCVGEFWTEILAYHGYIREEDVPEMRRLGVNYGKGLQLTNIVRDLSEDYMNGRIYLPSESKEQDSVIQASSAWMEAACVYLNDGESYSQALTSGRLKTATLLPARLGIKTIEAMKNASSDTRLARVKISRKQVFIELFKALL